MTVKERYFARSASDKTDDWPYWFIADRKMADTNVTATVVDRLFPNARKPGAIFLSKSNAESIARMANNNDS